jgi:biopolymer transport protein ExbB
MGSFIIIVLLLTSVIGLTFIVERGIALRINKVIPEALSSALETFRGAEDLPMLRRICEQHPSILSRLLLLADKRRTWSKAENISSLETTARHEVSRLERGLVVLEIVVGIAPLLGLVGTIYGLIQLFGSLGTPESGDNGRLAEGIATALHATLLGLLTAIPSLVAWSFYNKKIETMAIELASLSESFIIRLYHSDRPEEFKAARQTNDA